MNADFQRSNFTAVISDLHLCDEQVIDARNPLWKKYKSRDFFFDKDFANFLLKIQEMAQKKASELQIDPSVELVLNGDIFDFDSVCVMPESPPYKVSWLESRRGLFPVEEKSCFKMEVILRDHAEWIEALRAFILNGNRVVFVVGNHDVELLFPSVQQKIRTALHLPKELQANLRFCDWFYISNQDTLIEHGNQYDPYCVNQNPVHPLLLRGQRLEMRLPFGNIASRYMINGMGFFNPYVDSNYIMSIKEYVTLFLKYMARKQPFLVVTWFWGACVTLYQSTIDRLTPAVKDPATVEDHIEDIAQRSNASPRMVRELRELAVSPASSRPILIARELWLDRAFMILLLLLAIFQFFTIIHIIYAISVYWLFIPILLFIPFFLFYSSSITSAVHKYKEPSERVLSQSSQICKVRRVVYGHTHITRHEFIGIVEHLNSGTWSPAFLDVECTKALSHKNFIWLESEKDTHRSAHLMEFVDGSAEEAKGIR